MTMCLCGVSFGLAEVSQFSGSLGERRRAPHMYMRRVTALPFDSMLKRLSRALVDSFSQSRKPKQGQGESVMTLCAIRMTFDFHLTGPTMTECFCNTNKPFLHCNKHLLPYLITANELPLFPFFSLYFRLQRHNRKSRGSSMWP